MWNNLFGKGAEVGEKMSASGGGVQVVAAGVHLVTEASGSPGLPSPAHRLPVPGLVEFTSPSLGAMQQGLL